MPEMGLQELSAVQNWQKKALKLQAIKMRQQITDNRLVPLLNTNNKNNDYLFLYDR